MLEQHLKLAIPTTDGEFVATYSQHGLCRLDFPAPPANPMEPSKANPPAQVRAWHELAVKSVMNVLSGRPAGRMPPLDLTSGTAFQQSVWKALLRITCGQTRSYAEVARAVGRPQATRAVGGACGANPIPLLVPCHRVLAAHQKLGGFSSGLHWKRLLLARERSWLSD